MKCFFQVYANGIYFVNKETLEFEGFQISSE